MSEQEMCSKGLQYLNIQGGYIKYSKCSKISNT